MIARIEKSDNDYPAILRERLGDDAPSCLYVMDPQMKTIEMLIEMVKKSQGRAAIVDLGMIAKRVKAQAADK